MSVQERSDPYNEAAVLGIQDFELRGSGLVVPLFFKPDAAFMIRAVLEQEDDFTREAIVEKPGFREVCEGTWHLNRFASVFSDVRFTFNALGSTLIETAYKRGNNNVYRRNPDYTIVDEQGLLTDIR